jgi:hypothetical protein|tara:strand:- start:2887 stop:3846 length:960 start_codon:yes stop_codon:yes gene_type:complete
MSLFDDIQKVGSQLTTFLDEDSNRVQGVPEPTMPNRVNPQDVATFFNPNLALIEGAITGNVTKADLEKYKEAKGINDLFAFAARSAPSIGPNSRGFQTANQSLVQSFDAQDRQGEQLLTSLNKSRAEIGSTPPAISSARVYDMTTQENDSLIPEAFGAFDGIQMAAGKLGSAIGVKDIESNRALAAREGLNRDILSIGASLYSGRPSKFLLEQIQKTIPVGTLEGDDLAYSKYLQLKNIFRDQVFQMEGLKNNAETKSKKIEYENKLGDLNYMVDRLNLVTGSFEKNGYGAKAFYSTPGMIGGEFTEQDLNDLNNYFEQ